MVCLLANCYLWVTCRYCYSLSNILLCTSSFHIEVRTILVSSTNNTCQLAFVDILILPQCLFTAGNSCSHASQRARAWEPRVCSRIRLCLGASPPAAGHRQSGRAPCHFSGRVTRLLPGIWELCELCARLFPLQVLENRERRFVRSWTTPHELPRCHLKLRSSSELTLPPRWPNNKLSRPDIQTRSLKLKLVYDSFNCACNKAKEARFYGNVCVTVKRASGGKKIKWLKMGDLAPGAAGGALQPERADRVPGGDLGRGGGKRTEAEGL